MRPAIKKGNNNIGIINTLLNSFKSNLERCNIENNNAEQINKKYIFVSCISFIVVL